MKIRNYIIDRSVMEVKYGIDITPKWVMEDWIKNSLSLMTMRFLQAMTYYSGNILLTDSDIHPAVFPVATSGSLQVYKNGWNGCFSTEEIDEIIKELVEKGYVDIDIDGSVWLRFVSNKIVEKKFDFN